MTAPIGGVSGSAIFQTIGGGKMTSEAGVSSHGRAHAGLRPILFPPIPNPQRNELNGDLSSTRLLRASGVAGGPLYRNRKSMNRDPILIRVDATDEELQRACDILNGNLPDPDCGGAQNSLLRCLASETRTDRS